MNRTATRSIDVPRVLVLTGLLVAAAIAAWSAGCGGIESTQSTGNTPVTITNRQGAQATVYIAFGADSGLKASDWSSFCTNAGNLNCSFTLAANASRSMPNPNGKYINMTLAFNANVGCGSTKAELNVNNPNWYDILDVSLVDGFSNRVQIVATPSSGSPTNLGPPNGQTGNQSVFGLYPYGCDICVERKNPPCGISRGTDGCKAGTENNPNPPCQFQGPRIGGGGQSVEVILLP